MARAPLTCDGGIRDTLKKNQLIANLKKCEFGKVRRAKGVVGFKRGKEYFISIGHMIGGGKLRVDPEKIAAINQWPIPTSFTEARSFMGATQYLIKLIANFETQHLCMP